MTPSTTIRLSDDRDKALAVMEDMLRVCQKFRVGLFAREGETLRIALSDPIGKGPIQWKVKRAAPHKREFVTEWRDWANVPALFGEIPGLHRDPPSTLIAGAGKPYETYRAVEILDYLGQVLMHYQSAIIPAPVNGLPTMLLCDGVAGNWRAYSVVAELDCYGYTERGLRPQVTQ